MDAKAIAEENGAAAALLNGPRYWLMSSIGKTGRESLEHKTFGRAREVYELIDREDRPG